MCIYVSHRLDWNSITFSLIKRKKKHIIQIALFYKYSDYISFLVLILFLLFLLKKPGDSSYITSADVELNDVLLPSTVPTYR